jgi:hypothetical protein
MPRGGRQTAALSSLAFCVKWSSHSPARLDAAIPDYFDRAFSFKVLLKEAIDLCVPSSDNG